MDNSNFLNVYKNNFNWKVTLIDTGKNTMTGGRLLRLKKILENNTFLMTYGDGVSKVKQLSTFKHEGFWQCMDTKRDKINLEKIYKSKKYF